MPRGIYVRTEEHRKNLSLSHLGQKSARKGIKLTEEQRKKSGLKNIGRKISEETREKMSLSAKKRKRFPFSKETLEKMSKAKIGKVGEKHSRWIKDRSLIKIEDNRHSNPIYKEWRQSVYKRDKFKCRLNDKKCKGRLEAHHILDWANNPELRYEIINGITLCHAHHPRGRAEEKRLASLFKELVSVSK